MRGVAVCAKAGELERAYVVTRHPDELVAEGYVCVSLNDLADYITVGKAAKKVWDKLSKVPVWTP